jgi:hypothetical protein
MARCEKRQIRYGSTLSIEMITRVTRTTWAGDEKTSPASSTPTPKGVSPFRVLFSELVCRNEKTIAAVPAQRCQTCSLSNPPKDHS